MGRASRCPPGDVSGCWPMGSLPRLRGRNRVALHCPRDAPIPTSTGCGTASGASSRTSPRRSTVTSESTRRAAPLPDPLLRSDCSLPTSSADRCVPPAAFATQEAMGSRHAVASRVGTARDTRAADNLSLWPPISSLSRPRCARAPGSPRHLVHHLRRLSQDHERPVNAAPQLSLAFRIIFLYTLPHDPGLHPRHGPRDALPDGGRAVGQAPPPPAPRRQGLAQDRPPPRRRPAAACRRPARGRRRDAGRPPARARGVPGHGRGLAGRPRGLARGPPQAPDRPRPPGAGAGAALRRRAGRRVRARGGGPRPRPGRDPRRGRAQGQGARPAPAGRDSRRNPAPAATAGTPCAR